MADGPNVGMKAQDPGAGIRVDALAARAFSTIVSASGRGRRKVDPHFLDLLREASRASTGSACAAAVEELFRRGVKAEDITDLYIPELARQMGEAWCDDSMSFAEVTIAVSRLQSLVRDLGASLVADHAARADSPSVLIVVPQDVYHTLGAVVLANQLRRLGVSVRVMLGATPEDLEHQMQKARFDAVLISASHGVALESLRLLVNCAKTAVWPAPSVVIGGTIADAVEDLVGLTGADHVTSDPDEALKLCGLKISIRDTAPAAQGR